MLETIRSLMPYGILSVSVKEKKWLLEMMVTDNTRIPIRRVYLWADNFEVGLKNLLSEVQDTYSQILRELEESKKVQNLFED